MELRQFEEIISFAIKREIEAYEFYTKAQEMAFGDEAKEMLAEFAAEEKRHREILEEVKKESVENYVIKRIPNLKIADYLIDIPSYQTCRSAISFIWLPSVKRGLQALPGARFEMRRCEVQKLFDVLALRS